ncbi:MAG: hypothetical protein GX800_06570 [Clostridiaceae bacterium]|nr:hypothetical protein [Clostridiaceae bacterium]
MKSLLSDDLILCFFAEKLAEEPYFNGMGDNMLLSDYIAAARAMVEISASRYVETEQENLTYKIQHSGCIPTGTHPVIDS